MQHILETKIEKYNRIISQSLIFVDYSINLQNIKVTYHQFLAIRKNCWWPSSYSMTWSMTWSVETSQLKLLQRQKRLRLAEKLHFGDHEFVWIESSCLKISAGKVLPHSLFDLSPTWRHWHFSLELSNPHRYQWTTTWLWEMTFLI